MNNLESVNWLDFTIPRFIEHISAVFPSGTAIETPERNITFDQLNRMSNDFAYKILDQSTDSTYIPILATNFVESIIAQIAVLKAGKAAAILVANWPSSMLSQTLEGLDCSMIISGSGDENLAKKAIRSLKKELGIYVMSDFGENDKNPGITINPSLPAYVLFTSGSTSNPKGVIKSHQFMMHELIIRAEKYQMTDQDRVMITNDLFFGRTLFTTLSTFFGRATLVLKDLKKDGIHTLPKWLVDKSITIFSPTGSMLRAFNAILEGEERFPLLRIIRVGAEAVYNSDLTIVRQCITDECLIWVNYGSTETGSMCCNIFTKAKKFEDAIIPAGLPFKKKILLIKDEMDHEVPVGQPGQIVISSEFLSSGYIDHEQVNKHKFVFSNGMTTYYTGDEGRIREDGLVEIKGRMDQMVKIRGFRVDLAFIEMQINKLSEVSICAVTTQTKSGVEQIVAHLVLKDKGDLDSIKVQLVPMIPDYMMPSRFVLLDEMPRLPNGKIDRISLSEHSTDEIDPAKDRGPLNAVEREIMEIWKQVLKQNSLGVEANFFDIGGDSIAAAVMIAEVEKKYKIDLPSEVFWHNPTISGLSSAAMIRSSSISSEKSEFAEDFDNGVSESKRKRLNYLIEEVKKPESRLRLLRERRFKDKIRFLLRRFVQKYRKGMAIGYLHNWFQQEFIKVILNRLSYKQSVGLLSKLISLGLVALLIQRKRRRALQYFNRTINPELSQSQLNKAYLFFLLIHCNVVDRAIANYKNGNRQGVDFSIEGEQKLKDALAKGKGVMLVSSHSSASWWSRCLDYDIFTLTEVEAVLVSYGLEKYETAVYASQLREAITRLKNGEIIKIVADGDQGSGIKYAYTLAGLSKELFTGFAEVALQTDAVVIPVTPYMTSPFEVVFRFEEPLDLGSDSHGHSERIKHMVQQYADILEEQYQKYPWQMRIDQVLPSYNFPKLGE